MKEEFPVYILVFLLSFILYQDLRPHIQQDSGDPPNGQQFYRASIQGISGTLTAVFATNPYLIELRREDHISYNVPKFLIKPFNNQQLTDSSFLDKNL
jgi:hypothetical protein